MTSGLAGVRILRLIARLNVGGPAVHAVLLTQGLNGGRFASTLVTGVVSPGEGDMVGYARERGVNPVIVPELRRNVSPWNDVKAFFKILRILWSVRPDIIHTHTAKAGGLGRLAGAFYNLVRRLSGAPRARLIHTFHGHLFHGYFGEWKSRLLILTERILARLTDRVVTVSEELKRELAHVYRICPESRLVVIPLGLDLGWMERLSAERGRFRKEFGIDQGSLAIGIVGRLTSIKNHDLLLRAAEACRVKEARFLVVGDGERRVELEALSERLGLNGRVVFTGWQSDPAKVYADLDIACLTSLNEGTPLALIEAMAAGVPVMATKVGGVTDLMVGPARFAGEGFEIFENGILVPPDRSDVLSAAVEFLAARPETRRAMGVTGQRLVRKKFSVERLLSEMRGLYLEVLSR